MFTNAFLSRVLEDQVESNNPTPQFNRYQKPDLCNTSSSDIVNRALQYNQNAHVSPTVEELNQFLPKPQPNLSQSPNREEEAEQVKSAQSTHEINNDSGKKEKKIENQEQKNEFQLLKNQMLNIETLAFREINKLKLELGEKEQQIGKLLNVIKIMREKQAEQKSMLDSQPKYPTKKVEGTQDKGTQTQKDYKDEQIKSLKEALVRHIRINKDLTKKLVVQRTSSNNQNDQKSSNLLTSIEKLVSKIEM